jgi:hypothetical protein
MRQLLISGKLACLLQLTINAMLTRSEVGIQLKGIGAEEQLLIRAYRRDFGKCIECRNYNGKYCFSSFSFNLRK